MNLEESSVELEALKEGNFNLTVFVGNLDEKVTIDEVKQLFTQGNTIFENDILDVNLLWKVKNNEHWFSFAFVEFESEGAFTNALEFHKSMYCGRRIIILPSTRTHYGIFLMEKEVATFQTGATSEHEYQDCHKSEIESMNTDKRSDTEQDKDKNEKKVEIEIKHCETKTQDEVKIEYAKTTNEILQSNNSEVIGERREITIDNVNSEAKNSDDDMELEIDKHKANVKEEENATNSFVPVYKKSDFVAYLKHLPADVTEDEILKFFNFTRSDIVDILVLKGPRKKVRAKRSESRGIIAFKSKENLERCLSQSNKVLRSHCVIVVRHTMAGRNVGEKLKISKGLIDAVIPTADGVSENTKNTDRMELDLFVKHINWNASERLIKDFFSCGGAKVVGMKQFNESGTKFRGMGFVTMADHESLIKGLALNGLIFLGNKIKVSIRNDRRFLEYPVTRRTPSYSIFIGNLPIKRNAESLELALLEHFRDVGCSVERIHIPLADNHSGNRGYAFVSFQNEHSLEKALKFHNSEILLCDSKVFITVSKNWPENAKESSDVFAKCKESNLRHVNSAMDLDLVKSGRSNKRKRRVPTSPSRGNFSKTCRDSYKKFSVQDYPMKDNPKNQTQFQNYSSYGTEYNDYINYIEFRDYVAMRNAYEEQQVVSDYPSSSKRDLQQNQNNTQSYFSTVSQNSLGSYAIPTKDCKEGNVNNDWRSYESGTVKDRFNHNDASESSAIGYGKHLLTPVIESGLQFDKKIQSGFIRSYERTSQVSGGLSNSMSIEKNSHDVYSKRDVKNISDSKWPSNIDLYHRDESSLDSNSRWCGNNNSNYWERRESETLPKNNQSRESKISSTKSSFSIGERKKDYSIHPASADIPRFSNLHNTTVPIQGVVKSEHESGLYSRLEHGTASSSSDSYHLCRETVCGSNLQSLTSHASVTSRNKELLNYSHYPNVVKYENISGNSGHLEITNSFVNKLASSEIMNNAGYNFHLGYHAN